MKSKKTKKIAHEAPLCLMEGVQTLTDYDYALVHLFETNKKYYEFFKDALAKGREVILDNSLYELGESFDVDRYAYWIEKLRPTEYILPDVLDDGEGTVESAKLWMKRFGNLEGVKIGVVHGRDVFEMARCYEGLVEAGVDKIAFTFRGEAYERISQIKPTTESLRLASWCYGRIAALNILLDSGVIVTNMPHHLLGCALPVEFEAYKDEKFNWIESLDTSNPVSFGLEYKNYHHTTIQPYKPKSVIAEIMDKHVEDFIKPYIYDNISFFKRLVNE